MKILLIISVLFFVSCGVQKQQKITNTDLQILADDYQEEIEFQLDD